MCKPLSHLSHTLEMTLQLSLTNGTWTLHKKGQVLLSSAIFTYHMARFANSISRIVRHNHPTSQPNTNTALPHTTSDP